MSDLEFAFEMDRSLVIDPTKITEIVSSQDFLGGDWLKKTKHKLFNEPQLKKYFIPVDFRYYGLELISIIDPGTIIPRHAHTEPVYRYVLDGSFKLNGREFERDDWLIVPANYEYEIETRSGYRVLSKYHEQCEECTWSKLSKMPLGKL
ncbi:cupin domain-containing protein [Rhizobium sp. MHM7A]|uniref:cupin domain-containing protein n=1 Tax=Rhizobium sp. MHM7A TaxID=2583233 RepID=UPI0011062420|nr:cupin domain-containing protein [Rhizobium sp. MHM7A]TLX12263.1 cupin domain-containing protein [Rhizobium sp. MHM7A]